MLVRPASRRDDEGIWRIMEPIIRAGETYPLASDMSKADALNYWHGPEDEVFVVEAGDEILGTYHLRPNQAGGGSHIANVGYMTSSTATGKGVGRQMVEHSLQQGRAPKSRLLRRNKVPYHHGQITPPPLGFLKQPTDCGSTCLGSQSTISGKKMIKTIVIRKTT